MKYRLWIAGMVFVLVTGTSGSGLFSPQLTKSADAGLLTHGQNPVPSTEGQKTDTMPGLVAKSDDW